MKKPKVNIVTLLLSAIFAGLSIHAQTPVVLDTDPPPVAPQRSLVKTHGTAAAKYQKGNNVTYANSASIPLKLPNAGWGSLSAGFTSTGHEVVKPDRIVLSVFTAAKDRSFVDRPDVLIIVDGREIFEDKAKITAARTNGTEIYASFEISLTLADFEAVVAAEKVGIAVGPSAWWISRDEFSKFKDLLGIFRR